MEISSVDKPPRLAAVLTVSDSAHEGTREDASGPAVAVRLEATAFTVVAKSVVPDDRTRVAQELRRNGAHTAARSHLHHGRDRPRCRATSLRKLPGT